MEGVAPAPVVYFPGPAPRRKRHRKTRVNPRQLKARRRNVGLLLVLLGLAPVVFFPTSPWVWPIVVALMLFGLYALMLAMRGSPRERR
ncbi:MAG TPA: hypothetical protein VJ397_03050 [Thermoplasmata archaeon]|nr:hypothetical protein [Thermoplasmata archaeon]